MTSSGTVARHTATRPLAERALRQIGRGARTVAEAIATPLVPEDFLDLIDPMRSGAVLRGRVLDVRHETATSTTVTIRPGRGWRGHVPGQHLRIGVEVDGVRLWRSYSLTSPVDGDGTLTVTVGSVPDGKVSSHILGELRPGTIVALDQADGDFVLPRPAPEAVLFLTAGSGITPVMGMLRNPPLPADVVVVHSAPTEDRALFLPELRALAAAGHIRLHTRFTREEGRLQAAQLDELVPDWRSRQTWACGPGTMLEDLEAYWAEHDLADALHTERFRTTLHAVGEGGTATFATSGVSVEADAATTLLVAGEDAGILMPHGCRMGICHNCLVPLTEGSVRDLRTGDLTTGTPDDPTLVQTCVSAAAGPCHLSV